MHFLGCEVSEMSCTDLRQKWGKEQVKAYSSSEFTPCQLSSMCHVQAKPRVRRELPRGFAEFALKEFMTACPDGEFTLTKELGRSCGALNIETADHHSVKKALNRGKRLSRNFPQSPSVRRRKSAPPAITASDTPEPENEVENNGSIAPVLQPSGRQPLSYLSLNLMAPPTAKVSPAALQESYKFNCARRKAVFGQETPKFPLVERHFVEKVLQSNISETFGCESPAVMDVEDASHYMENVCISLQNAIELCLRTAEQSASKEWMMERKPKRITGSNAHVFDTRQSPEDSAYWTPKVQKFLDTDVRQNFSMSKGLIDEPYALLAYQRETCNDVFTSGLYVNPSMPWCGFSGDGFVPERNALVEVKCPDTGVNETARAVVSKLDYVKRMECGKLFISPGHRYYKQVQMGMALWGLSWCHFVVYSSFDESIVIIDVPFNHSFAAKLLRKLSTNYFKYYLPEIRKRYGSGV